jgi:hypothetical protein
MADLVVMSRSKPQDIVESVNLFQLSPKILRQAVAPKNRGNEQNAVKTASRNLFHRPRLNG